MFRVCIEYQDVGDWFADDFADFWADDFAGGIDGVANEVGDWFEDDFADFWADDFAGVIQFSMQSQSNIQPY